MDFYHLNLRFKIIKMSDIWKYFEKIAGDKARCKIQSCKKEVCRKQESTKGMWVHLERQHREEFNKLKDIGSDGQKEKVSFL
jgi:hypothetical protein